jgi:thioester reductase-like protein
MDLGLSGAEYRAVGEQVTRIFHTAAIYYLGTSRELAERVNIQGTRNVLELAAQCKRLRRLSHFSTAQVSGMRKGVVMEDELEEGQRFHNAYEQTKFEAERLARQAMSSLPVSIFRPGIIVGDSRSGEIDKFDGPYYLLTLILSAPVDVHLPLPGNGNAPLYLVPIDFVIEAAIHLTQDERAEGKTFHLTDPSPLSTRRLYQVVAEHAHRKSPLAVIPSRVARLLLRTPGLERVARAPLSFLEAFDQLVFYNTRNTLELLRGTGLYCPPFERYVDNLIRYIRSIQAEKQKHLEDEVSDPFD